VLRIIRGFLLAGANGDRDRGNVERMRSDGAMSNELSPVMVTIGLALVLKPSLRSTSMPCMYWPVGEIRSRGNATLSNALSENSVWANTGAANCSSNSEKSTGPLSQQKSRPEHQNG
jgi:hypothetical protein